MNLVRMRWSVRANIAWWLSLLWSMLTFRGTRTSHGYRLSSTNKTVHSDKFTTCTRTLFINIAHVWECCTAVTAFNAVSGALLEAFFP